VVALAVVAGPVGGRNSMAVEVEHTAMEPSCNMWNICSWLPTSAAAAAAAHWGELPSTAAAVSSGSPKEESPVADAAARFNRLQLEYGLGGLRHRSIRNGMHTPGLQELSTCMQSFESVCAAGTSLLP
jgi:hypothetical protein